jgi:hypothetical protein
MDFSHQSRNTKKEIGGIEDEVSSLSQWIGNRNQPKPERISAGTTLK